MIRFYMPWSMGKTTDYICPNTFLPKASHPYLEYSNVNKDFVVKQEISHWMNKNFKYCHKVRYDKRKRMYFLDFEDQRDLTLFLLRWK